MLCVQILIMIYWCIDLIWDILHTCFFQLCYLIVSNQNITSLSLDTAFMLFIVPYVAAKHETYDNDLPCRDRECLMSVLYAMQAH